MNLQRLVRGPIAAVNKNQMIPWLKYLEAVNDPVTGKATPTYAQPKSICAQIQPVPTDELAHLDQLNIQGVLRQVYMHGAVGSAVREDGTGGDLLQFPEIVQPKGPMRTWLVMRVEEQWPSWCKVIVRLQNDQNNG